MQNTEIIEILKQGHDRYLEANWYVPDFGPALRAAIEVIGEVDEAEKKYGNAIKKMKQAEEERGCKGCKWNYYPPFPEECKYCKRIAPDNFKLQY